MWAHLPLILKNSVRNRRRCFLTVASIGASLCLLGVLFAMAHSFYFTEASPDQALRLITRNRVSLANPLPVSYQPRIARVAGVKEVVILQWFGGTYKDSRDPANFFARFAVEPDRFRKVYPEYRIPDAEFQAFLNERTACLIGRKIANRHNLKPGDRITVVGDIFPVTLEFTVRAIYDFERDTESLFFHYKYLDESLGERRQGMVGTFVLRMERPEDAARISKEVDDMFRNAPFHTKTETERAFELSFLAFLGNVKAFFLAVCSAITFTILLVAANTMAMSVRERTREVGILKTLGYTPGKILGLLVGESVVLSVAGGVVGLLLARGLIGVLQQMPSTFSDNSRLALPAPVAALCLGVAATIGIISCIVPAWSASRRPIVEALRLTD